MGRHAERAAVAPGAERLIPDYSTADEIDGGHESPGRCAARHVERGQERSSHRGVGRVLHRLHAASLTLVAVINSEATLARLFASNEFDTAGHPHPIDQHDAAIYIDRHASPLGASGKARIENRRTLEVHRRKRSIVP